MPFALPIVTMPVYPDPAPMLTAADPEMLLLTVPNTVSPLFAVRSPVSVPPVKGKSREAWPVSVPVMPELNVVAPVTVPPVSGKSREAPPVNVPVMPPEAVTIPAKLAAPLPLSSTLPPVVVTEALVSKAIFVARLE